MSFLGRLFDKNGNVKDWWSLLSKLDFEERTECLVKQYNNYQVFGEYVSKTKHHLGQHIKNPNTVHFKWSHIHLSFHHGLTGRMNHLDLPNSTAQWLSFNYSHLRSSFSLTVSHTYFNHVKTTI